MREHIKLLRDKITAGSPVLFIGISIMDSAVIELAALAGYDAAVVDNSQLFASPERICAMIVAGEARGMPVVVRVSSLAEAAVYMNSGACGVMFDNVGTAETAKTIISACRFPPLGQRGISVRSRANDYGLSELTEAVRKDNAELLIILQIEDLPGIESLEEILDVPGIDMISTGRNDLAAALGVIGQPKHPKVQEAEKRISETAKRKGQIPVLRVPNSAEHARQLLREGNAILSTGQDIDLLLSAFRQNVGDYRNMNGES